MKIERMKVNRLTNPMGFELNQPSLSWTVTDTNAKKQESARITVALDEAFSTSIYDSGRRADISSLAFNLPFVPEMATRYFWQVEVWADNGEYAKSEPAWFETGKAGEWTAEWISPRADKSIQAVVYRELEIDRPVKRARMYMTGLGLYELYLNGEKQGEECLLPGFNDYSTWIQYQTFELSVAQGHCRIEILLGDGWYKGNYGLTVKYENYGNWLACIGELVLDYEDGSRETIVTDTGWKARRSTIVSSGIYCGEVQDMLSDTEERFDVETVDISRNLLCPRLSPRILIHERLTPIEVIQTPAGETVLDMGQNMVGWLGFQCSQPKGTQITFQFGEILQNGNFYRDNLRSAKAEFVYTSDGTVCAVRQHFTFYGFRYVKISGWVGEINKEDFQGLVIYSEMEEIGKLETSDPLVNQLVQNTKWGQKGNFIDIPTDCPQRDERMGWTGDAQIFSGTACFLTDAYAFYWKYGKDVWTEQQKLGGSVPYVAPQSNYKGDGSTAWGEAATVIPWNVYLHSGDPGILKQQYPGMKAWVDYMKCQDDREGGKGLWKRGSHFGDWLALDGKIEGGVYGATDPDLIASAYYFYSTGIVAKTAGILGYAKEARQYSELADKIRDAFVEEYFTPAGRLAVDTMTAYVVVLYMGLVPERYRETVCLGLKKKLIRNGYHLETGFVGTPYLCRVLSENGMNSIAYHLLMEKGYPGWLYEVLMGATTIWERWNSVLPDGSISGTTMNSLNHYSYGSITEWMFRDMAGLQPVEEAPGFKRAKIAPKPDYQLRSARAELNTAAGKYVSEWEIRDEGRKLYVRAEVPFDAEAELILPYSERTELLTAGTWEFEYEPEEQIRQRYDIDSLFADLMQDDRAREIVTEDVFGGRVKFPFADEVQSLRDILDNPFVAVPPKRQKEIDEKLRAL